MNKNPLIFMVLAIALVAHTCAFAIGTAAGTNISNTAQLTYYDNNGTQIAAGKNSNTVVTVINQVAAVDVATTLAAQNSTNEAITYYPATIANLGNGTDAFALSATSTAGWTPASINIYQDVNLNGGYDAGIDTLLGAMSTGPLAADAIFSVLVAVEAPDVTIAPNGSTNTVTLVATSTFNPGILDSQSFLTTNLAPRATVHLVASTLTPKPGDIVTFTATVTNAGGNAIKGDIAFTTAQPADLTYVTGSISVGGVGKTDPIDADNADFSAGAVHASLPPIAGGGSVDVIFRMQVNSDVPSGTPVSVTSVINYVVGSKPRSHSDTATLVIASLAGVLVATPTTTDTKTPDDMTTFPIVITNTGNFADTFDLTAFTAGSWVYSFYSDLAGTLPLTDSDGDSKLDVVLAQGASTTAYLGAHVPANAADASTSSATATITSSYDTAVTFTTGALTTTVASPRVKITKQADKSQANPGETITYTIVIENIGTGAASNILLTDPVPAFTTFAGGLMGGYGLAINPKTAANDGDEVKFNGTTVSAGDSGAPVGLDPSGGANSKYTLIYQVTVD